MDNNSFLDNSITFNRNKAYLPPLKETVKKYRDAKNLTFELKGSEFRDERQVLPNLNEPTDIKITNDITRNYTFDNISQNVYNDSEKIDGYNSFDNSESSIYEGHYEPSDVDDDDELTKDESDNFSEDYLNSERRNVLDDLKSEIYKQNDYHKVSVDMPFSRDRSKIDDDSRLNSDYVLVHSMSNNSKLNASLRKKFLDILKEKGVCVVETAVGRTIFTELYSSFDCLCKEAEAVHLHMPLAGYHSNYETKHGCFVDIYSSFKTEYEVDMISAEFNCSTKRIFFGIENASTFFRPAYRSMLLHHMLSNVQVTAEENSSSQVKGLNGLLHAGAFKDVFVLHDRSEYDQMVSSDNKISYWLQNSNSSDSRKELHGTWLKWFKFQPFWKIRNYYGEKIGLYFAWLGVFVTSLWIPVFLGIAVFVYGFISAYVKHQEDSHSSEALSTASKVTDWASKALDNDTTPIFALLVCLWGTVFLELWKRKNAELAFKWDVDSFEEQEPNRAKFFGTKTIFDPLTGMSEPHYPSWRKVLKSLGSLGVISFMVLLVVTSVVSVVVYKVVSRVDWFRGQIYGSFMSSLTASVLNSISILLLGRVYKTLAYKLTDWENHRTRTQYEDALVMKLFGFQFVNSYASLYYIAFFRERTNSEGVFGLGTSYSDSCGESNDCMSLLSMQVAVLIVVKPMPKVFTDFILPFLRKGYKHLKKVCCCCTKSKNQITIVSDELPSDKKERSEYEQYLKSEYHKPPLADFTLSEYTEKVLQYGYLMLFAAAFPLAPLVAIITNIIDMRVDARRLLWFNRRPIAERAEDIGMWFTILSFLNYVGMITNAFIIGLLSRFGKKYQYENIVYNFNTTLLNPAFNQSSINITSINTNEMSSLTIPVHTYRNLWIIVIFENVALAVKFLLAYLIADEPEYITKAKKAQKVHLENVLRSQGLRPGPGKSVRPLFTPLQDISPDQTTPSPTKKRNKKKKKKNVR